MTAGELTYIQPDKTTVYKAGDCFFETGAVSHTAHNATQEPAVLLNFQLLPADWSKGSAIPPEQPAESHTRNTRSCMSLRGRVRRWCMNRRLEAIRGPGPVGARWATISA